MPPATEKEIFLQALDIDDPAEREVFLAGACAGDAKLLEGIQDLLSSLADSAERFEPESYETLESERVSVQSLVSGEVRFLDRLGSAKGKMGNYELLEEIGRGAMGIVFRALQADLDREVALKVVLNAGFASPGERERFRLEAAAAARIEHPNIVPIYEIGASDDHDYYSMLLVKGGTLADVVRSGEAIPPGHAVRLMLKVADAVQAAHEHGIIHRDLKPENILLAPNGEPMVSDFGLARLVESEGGLTLSGQILGTPRYMAPEMTTNADAASTRSDIYAVGAILYELLVGEPLFEGGSILTTLRMVQEQAPVRPRVRVPHLDRDLETIVLKCLEKSPGDRYSTARDLCGDLNAWIELRPIAARPVGAFERLRKWTRRRPVHAALAGLAAMFVLSLGIGGPWVAIHQRALRTAAEDASHEADTARKAAELAATESRRQAEVNRRLAYSANQRYIQLSHELQGDSSLASELMITGWVPERGEDDLRGWEWYFNLARVHSDEKTFHIAAPVTSLGFDPKGETVVASGPQGTEIRNTLSGALVRRLTESGGHRKSLWSPGGDSVLTVTPAGRLGIWKPDIAEKREILGGFNEVLDVDWKEETLVTLHPDGIRCWSFGGSGDPEPAGIIATGGTRWERVALSPDGEHLAAIGESKSVLVWNRHSLDEPLLKLDGAASRPVSIGWKPDGSWVAASTQQNAIRIWEVPGGQRVGRIGFKEDGPVREFAWNPEGDQIALLEPTGRQVDVFDLIASKGKPLRGFAAPHVSQHVAWSPEGHTIAVGDDSGLVALVRHGLPPATRELFKHTGPLLSLHWTPDGSFLSCLSGDSQIYRIDTVTGKASDPTRVPRNDPQQPIAWNPRSGTLAFTRGGQVEIVGRRPGSSPSSTRVPFEELASIVWLDGRDFLICGARGEVEFGPSEPEGNKIGFALPDRTTEAGYHAFSASPDRRHLLGTGGGRLTTWSLEDGSITHDRLPQITKWQESCHAWDPGNPRFATANSGGLLSIWELGADEPVRQFRAHRGPVLDLAWHPGGDRLASAGRDGLICIWDPETGEMLLKLQEHKGPVRDIEWDADGRRLASCGEDGTLRIWDASAGMLLSSE